MPTISWKDVIEPKKRFGHVDIFLENVVYPSDYEYFLWNGRVYKVLGERNIQSTNFKEEDIK